MLDLIFIGTLSGSIFIVVLLIYIAAKSLGNNSDDHNNEQIEQRSSRQSTSSGLPSSLRHRSRHIQNSTNQYSGDENESDDNDGGFNIDDSALKGKIGVKKQRKLEMKAEKKQAREIELQEREERKKRMEELDKQRKLEDDKLAAEEKAKADAERLEKERKEKEEHEEYLKLKQCFEVEEEGYDGDVNEEDSQNKLQTFIDYIKNHKVVHMDELAGNFNLKTQDVIQRLQDLLEQELLLGVIDDRGKFIYITNEELQQVATFIRQRGRVSISELAENSNTFINLVPVEANN